jgi:RNA recognition motif-containing protein
VEIKRNYAFVEYKEVADAVEAQKRSHGALMSGRTITVEFVESSREKGGRCVLCTCGFFRACRTACLQQHNMWHNANTNTTLLACSVSYWRLLSR